MSEQWQFIIRAATLFRSDSQHKFRVFNNKLLLIAVKNHGL